MWQAALSVLLVLFVSHAHALDSPLYKFSWLDDQGKQVSLSQWQGKPVLITMAYSTCRKICPMSIHRLKEIQRLYDERKIDAAFVVISYDPQNDSWQTWAQYRKNNHLDRENWHFLTGSLDDTKAISELLGMSYWFYDDHPMHSLNIVRLGKNGTIEKSLGWENQEHIEALLPE